MKSYLLILALFLLQLTGLSQNSENSASKSIFKVIHNGTEYSVIEGEETAIGNSEKVSVTLSDFKKFDNGFISFNYPSNYRYSQDSDVGFKSWGFDGDNYVVTIFKIDGITQVSEFIESMVSQFGAENCITKDIKRTVGNKTLKGVQLNVVLAGQKIEIHFLKIAEFATHSVYINFQDSNNDDGSSSIESVETFNIINSTIKFK